MLQLLELKLPGDTIEDQYQNNTNQCIKVWLLSRVATIKSVSFHQVKIMAYKYRAGPYKKLVKTRYWHKYHDITKYHDIAIKLLM